MAKRDVTYLFTLSRAEKIADIVQGVNCAISPHTLSKLLWDWKKNFQQKNELTISSANTWDIFSIMLFLTSISYSILLKNNRIYNSSLKFEIAKKNGEIPLKI